MIRAIQRAAACVAVLIATAGQVQAGIILSDDFDPGLGSGTFQSTQNAAALGNGLQGFLSGNALHFGGQASSTPFAITNPLDVSQGGSISFDFRGGNELTDGEAFWEDSESNEWADLAYSIDGGTNFIDFQILNTEMDEGENPTTWNNFNIVIPLAAQTTLTQFRFQQRAHSGPDFDHWAIDNLVITTNDLAPVPEPSSLALFGICACVAGFGAARRRRREKQQEATA
ncbi:PEP-CTERM sorting domain-containing protein [Thalassoglobus sp.]|uniref:PEP-CTERM sorting domain-containing protein n=1 Tax=Thalassoglobus sp. TaxID=2795869 RepID=UPI003AA829A2